MNFIQFIHAMGVLDKLNVFHVMCHFKDNGTALIAPAIMSLVQRDNYTLLEYRFQSPKCSETETSWLSAID
jgi:hypothetical protein